MKRQLDMDKIARELGAERRGKVSAAGGYTRSASCPSPYRWLGMLTL
jgi:hypothetical protein